MKELTKLELQVRATQQIVELAQLSNLPLQDLKVEVARVIRTVIKEVESESQTR